jgi:pimeloyl-ACP methyl ester carboxylesterase
MNDDRYGLYPISKKSNSDFDVIFIHGLGGDKNTTWQNNDGYSWQNWLAEDYNASIWTLGYGANRTNWIEDDMPLEEAASYFLSTLKSNGIGAKPFIFIVHSLGGLLVKHILLKANLQKDYQELVDNCKSIVFFAVPHTGSGWASLLDYAKPVLRNSNLLKALPKGSDYLNNLVGDFNALIHNKQIETNIFYETKELRASGIFGWLHLKKGIVIVSKESATHIHTNNPLVALPEDHLSICKISSKESDIYSHKIKMI